MIRLWPIEELVVSTAPPGLPTTYRVLLELALCFASDTVVERRVARADFFFFFTELSALELRLVTGGALLDTFLLT